MPHFSRQTKPKKKGGETKNNVPLFAFNADKEYDGTTGRPKRKLKAVVRFDPLSFDKQRQGASCRVGYGFDCPRCSAVCSYDSRVCDECHLECYYEAGIGVVTLKERRANNHAPKQSTTMAEEVDAAVGGSESVADGASCRSRSTTKKKKGINTMQSNLPAAGSSSNKNNTEEPAEGFPTGWVTRQFLRSNKSKRKDRFWYSPKNNFKFRYKYEAQRFLEELKSTADGDEVVAMLAFKQRQQGKGKTVTASGGVLSDDCGANEEGANGDANPLSVQVQLFQSELQTTEGGDNTPKETELLKQQLLEARSQITVMTERLSSTLGEKAGLTDMLQSMRDEAKIQTAKISELELVIESLNVPNKTVSEHDSMPAAVTEGSKSDTTSSARLSTEISLEDTVDQLREQNRGLMDELKASKYNGNELRSQLETANSKRQESQDNLKKVSMINLRISSELTGLESKYKEAKAFNEASISSNARIADLTTQVSRLTSERDELVKQGQKAFGAANEDSSSTGRVRVSRLTSERDELVKQGQETTPEVLSPNVTVPAETELSSGNQELGPEMRKSKDKVKQKKKRGRPKTTTDPKNAPLFAFGAANEDSSSTGRVRVSRLTSERDELVKQGQETTPEVLSPNVTVPAETELSSGNQELGPEMRKSKDKVKQKKKRGRPKTTTDPKNAPLFAFGAANEDSSSTGRPKRKLKCVKRFDPMSFNNNSKPAAKLGMDSTAPDACGYAPTILVFAKSVALSATMRQGLVWLHLEKDAIDNVADFLSLVRSPKKWSVAWSSAGMVTALPFFTVPIESIVKVQALQTPCVLHRSIPQLWGELRLGGEA
eukprot:CAMPEP_0201902992 /NCGR_PEP_ID=MMETSP0902-20130614/55246_1 /ASSEMBLY_ACC=CAM_ASM_000551 /TAXON_ID=420261 /ORGANISM="Thalassiosira antarctica, Strain CCMP982" /LENGTH=830 /DNA_ID=CAMNT_0048437019 /DNA_START=198 /DNA_END=2693 /DNA_ORIENTATION=+